MARGDLEPRPAGKKETKEIRETEKRINKDNADPKHEPSAEDRDKGKGVK